MGLTAGVSGPATWPQQEKLISWETVTDKQIVTWILIQSQENHTLRIPRNHTQKFHSLLPKVSALNRYWVMVGTDLSMAAHMMAHLMAQIKFDL